MCLKIGRGISSKNLMQLIYLTSQAEHPSIESFCCPVVCSSTSLLRRLPNLVRRVRSLNCFLAILLKNLFHHRHLRKNFLDTPCIMPCAPAFASNADAIGKPSIGSAVRATML